MVDNVYVTHTKVDGIADWTQVQVDALIAAGKLPAGTTLANVILSSDWNANHTLVGMTELLSSIRSYVVINMGADDYTMTLAEATAYLKVLTNVGVGKTLTWPTTSDGYTSVDQAISMQYATNPVILASETGGGTITLPAGAIGSSAITYLPGAAVVSKNQIDGVYYRAGHNGVNVISDATYTLVAADVGCLVVMANALASTLTIPPLADVTMIPNAVINVMSTGVAGLTIAAGAGVTIIGVLTLAVNRSLTLMRDGTTDTWYTVG